MNDYWMANIYKKFYAITGTTIIAFNNEKNIPSITFIAEE
jgi:GDP-D-mannose dehydratase